MPWVRFTENFDWWPSSQVTISYRKGMVKNVTRRCAEKAKAEKKAVSASRPKPDAPEGSP